MTQSGVPAALQGYRLQALYTLRRIFAPGIDGTHLFQPEGTEDLDILDQDGAIVEAIQVKSYSDLTLSDLEPEKGNSFLRRAVSLLEGENPPVIKLVNFGAIGPELSQAWEGDELHRERIVAKLVDKGFERDNVERLFESIELVSLEEDKVREVVLSHIRDLSTGIDPANAFDLFVAWYYRLAERRQVVSCADLINKVNAVGRFLAQRYNYHKQWHTTIEPLEAFPIDEEQVSQLRDEFYAGVRARYEHILADLDFPREHKIVEIHQAFRENNVVILHAASGQGKSTLAYRYLHDIYSDKWRFSVERVQDVEHALSIALALSGFASAVEVPIAVYLDVHPRDTEWPELVRQLADQPFLEILVTIREEDYRRANVSGADFNFVEVGLDFDRSEAELIYERARSTSDRWDFLDFDAAWHAFGGEGPLMEFVYLLTQTETLQQRLESQVQRIEDEVRRGEASPDERRLLSLVAVASAYGARLRTYDVIEALELSAPNRTLERFEKEYLLRRTTGGVYLEGLHPIRSDILSRLLIHTDVNPWLDIVEQVLPLILEKDLETFILHALVDEYRQRDHDRFLHLVMDLQPRTWSGIGGVLRSLLWVGAREYVADNRAVLDAAHSEMGPGWQFAVDFNFALPGEGPELGEWWTTLGSLIPPERQARIKAIRENQTPKNALFQRPQDWLRSLSKPPVPPSGPETWRDVAEVWYWATRLIPDRSFVDWVTQDELDASVADLPLTILADLSFALHLSDVERHQGWLEDHEDTLHRRLANQQNILALEEIDRTLNIYFIPSGDVEVDRSDPLHAETMAKIDLMRRLFPGHERYGAQGYGFKLAGIELPQDDSIRKDGVPATYLPPKWLIRLNSMVGGIERLRYRPDSWDAYLDKVLEIRRCIADCLDELNRGLMNFYQRTKAINVGSKYINLQSWQRCGVQLSGVLDLPKSAVDPWGFASETAADSSVQALTHKGYVPTAIALQKYKPYLKAQREYFASVRDFFNQAPAIWITNANAGKLHPNDPKRKMILEALQEQDVRTDPYLPTYNLFEGKTQLPAYQSQFRALFKQHLGEDETTALERRENEVLATSCTLWYFYAYEPWKGAASPRWQVPQWMDVAKRQVKARVQQALETIQAPECRTALLDYDRRWQDSPALWAKLELSDPTRLYAILETFPAALHDILGHLDLGSLTYYLIREVCQYIVIIPVIRGRMLDELIWPFHTLTILQAESVQEKPWAYFPQELTDVIREELHLDIWDKPEILTANQLSRSVATLRQLTSQISEFEGMPDLTEPGLERLQSYVVEELSGTMSTSLQTFFDVVAELLERFNTLPESEQQKRDYFSTAIEALSKAYEYVRPGEGDGVFKLDLREIVAYAQRLEEIYPVVEEIRLLWIADILEQEAISQERRVG
jgi:hypothetical protein